MRALSILTLTVMSLAAPASADQVLFDFEKPADLAGIKTQDATVAPAKTPAGTALLVRTGHKNPWPGITLPAPAGKWDLSQFDRISIDVQNVGNEELTVRCRVDNPGADGVNNCNNGSLTLAPGAAGTLTVAFNRRPPGPAAKLFGMRGYPGGAAGTGGTIDPANVTQLLVFLAKPSRDHVFQIDNVRAAGRFVASTLPADKPFFPFIDTFGQYKHADWPGKIHAPEDLVRRRQEEEKDLADKPGPADFNRYGGWASGPALKATGFFRVEKHQGRWWLVDPEGRLFWSHGIDCVRSDDYTPIDERDEWFENPPWLQKTLAEFLLPSGHALHGHYAGRKPRCFNFAGANLKRKYGDDWRNISAAMAHRRLRSWGMNTIANWSDPAIYLMRRTPYTATIHFTSRMLEGSQGYWGKFRDVFDPSFAAGIRKSMAGQSDTTAGDPWCIGYFVDNEIAWGDEVSLAVAALVSPADQPAKLAFVEDLKAKYGDIAKLNAAWGTAHESWEALIQSRNAPDRNKARDDLTAFYTRTAETYFKTIRDAIKAVAPNQLYLGCRFAWGNPRATAAAAKFCDVVSFNLYRRSVADFKLPAGIDVPLIIGEFHFGALDRGMFHTGLVRTSSQEERADAYRQYVRGALRHPQFVGCHWFQYRDQPTTGRVLDGENYQIGFVDIADSPYPETIAASRDVGYAMYRYRTGK